MVAKTPTESSLAATYGSFRRSREVDKIFETYQVLPDFTYYYSGPDFEPTAILGIRNDYSLRSRLWKRVALTQPQLRAWVDRMSDPIDVAPMPCGFFILDGTGKAVGIFYSIKGTRIKMDKDNEIVVHVPDQAPFIEQG